MLRGVAKTPDGLELDLYNSILLDATESDLEARSWSVRGTIIRVEEKDVGYTSVAGECDDSSDSSLSRGVKCKQVISGGITSYNYKLFRV